MWVKPAEALKSNLRTCATLPVLLRLKCIFWPKSEQTEYSLQETLEFIEEKMLLTRHEFEGWLGIQPTDLLRHFKSMCTQSFQHQLLLKGDAYRQLFYTRELCRKVSEMKSRGSIFLQCFQQNKCSCLSIKGYQTCKCSGLNFKNQRKRHLVLWFGNQLSANNKLRKKTYNRLWCKLVKEGSCCDI